MFVIVRKIRIVAEDCVLIFVMYFTLVISDLIGKSFLFSLWIMGIKVSTSVGICGFRV